MLGILLVWHYHGIKDGVKRAVEHIQDMEDKLGLPNATKWLPRYIRPLEWAMWINILVCLSGGAYLWWAPSCDAMGCSDERT